MSGTLQVLLRVSFEGQATPQSPSAGLQSLLKMRRLNAELAEHAEKSWAFFSAALGGLCVERDGYRPVAADAASAGLSCSMLTGRRNGIIARSRTPTASIGCARSACRVALKCGRPALCSVTHARAYSPLLICSSITFISRRVASVTMRGPPV